MFHLVLKDVVNGGACKGRRYWGTLGGLVEYQGRFRLLGYLPSTTFEWGRFGPALRVVGPIANIQHPHSSVAVRQLQSKYVGAVMGWGQYLKGPGT